MKLGRKEAAWWLCQTPGLGAVRLRQLAKILGKPEEIWEAAQAEGGKDGAGEEGWKQSGFYGLFCEKAKSWQAQSGERLFVTGKNIGQLLLHRKEAEKLAAEYHRWAEAGIQFITVWDDGYPKRLLPLYDRPFALYVRGSLPKEDRKTAAVIGARACSAYGGSQGRKIGRELAQAGVQIISGLAYGVDSAGHKGALDAAYPASTYAVLGCGPDRCYPREHARLAGRILENGGGLLSEYPPGTDALAGHFPMRNRIISGLSDCVLVIEARKKSGSLITVDQALEQGKEVFALPGRVDDPLSEGCHRLLEHGAALLTGSDAALDFLFPGREKNGDWKGEAGGFEKNALAQEKNMVYSCLDYRGKTIEELITLTGLPLNGVRTELLRLLTTGRITETARGYYARLPR